MDPKNPIIDVELPTVDSAVQPVEQLPAAQPTAGKINFTPAEAKRFVDENKRSKLFNRQTMKSELLPADQLEEAVKSGTHFYKKGTPLTVKSPDDGSIFEVQAEDLQDMLNAGYQLESAKEAAIREFVDAPGNQGLEGALKVFGRSALDEATFGAAGAAEKYGDPLELAQLNALAEQNKAADWLGTGAGFIATLPLGGPVTKAASKIGGKLLGKEIAEKVGGEISQKSAESLFKKIGEKSLEFGTEGVIYSAPRAFTEAAYGDPDAAAQTLLAGGAFGALFGAGYGASAEALKKANKLKNDYFADFDRIKRTAYEIAGINAEKATQIQSTNPEVDDFLPSYLSEIATENPKALNNSKLLSELVDQKTELAGKRIDQIVNTLDTNIAAKKSLADELDQAGVAAGYPDLNRVISEIDNEFLTPLRMTDPQTGATKFIPGYEREAAELDKYLQNFASSIEFRYGSSQPQSLKALIDLKREVGGLVRFGDKVTNSLQNDALEALRGKINKVVNDEVVPRISKGFPELANLADEFKHANLQYATGESIGRNVLKEANKDLMKRPAFSLTDLMLTTAADGLKQAGKILLTKEVLRQGRQNLERKNLMNLNNAFKKTAEVLDDTPKLLSGKMKIPEFLRLPQNADSVIRGRGTRAFTSVFQTMFGLTPEETKNNEQLYKSMSNKFSEYYSVPELTSQKISAATSGLAEMGAPLIAMSANAYMINTLEYINSIMPKPQMLENPIFKQRAYIPSDREMYKFARKLEIVNNPLIVLKNLKDGTLSADEVQVAQDLYPAVLNKIRSKVVDYLATSEKVIPYSDRLKYSLLLGLDSDASVQPQNILALQKTYQSMFNNPPLQPTANLGGIPSRYRENGLETAVSRFQT